MIKLSHAVGAWHLNLEGTMDAKFLGLVAFTALVVFAGAFLLTPVVESFVRAPATQPSLLVTRALARPPASKLTTNTQTKEDGKAITVGMMLSLCVVPSAGGRPDCARTFQPVDAGSVDECEHIGWQMVMAGDFKEYLQKDGSEVRPAFDGCTYREDSDSRQIIVR